MEGHGICEVRGLKVGHFTDARRPTGCTVVLCDKAPRQAWTCAALHPGTRETDLLAPENTVEQIHAILLTGGSAFGLDAAGGVMRWLAERGHGLAVGQALVPIVPAAVLFDLWLGDPAIHPDAAAGYAACEAASVEVPREGSVGAGTGATVGKLFGTEHAMKGGIGTASLKVGGVTVGALWPSTRVGDVVDPSNGSVIAGARGADGKPLGAVQAILRGALPSQLLTGMSTTLGIVATDARLSKAQAKKMAQMSHDGLARTINPVHTPFDGDVMFALATGASGLPGNMSLLGALAAEVTAMAVLRAVRAATGLPGVPAAADM